MRILHWKGKDAWWNFRGHPIAGNEARKHPKEPWPHSEHFPWAEWLRNRTWKTGGILFREYCFGRENSLSSAFRAQWVLRKARWVRLDTHTQKNRQRGTHWVLCLELGEGQRAHWVRRLKPYSRKPYSARFREQETETGTVATVFPKPKAEPEPPAPFSREPKPEPELSFPVKFYWNTDKPFLQRSRWNRKPEPLEPFHLQTVTEPNWGLPARVFVSFLSFSWDFGAWKSKIHPLPKWQQTFSLRFFSCNGLGLVTHYERTKNTQRKSA